MKFNIDIEEKLTTEVLVVGGGPAGVAAAIAARHLGKKVLLIESSAMFGGLGTRAMVPAFMQFSNGVDFLAEGVGRQVLDRMHQIGGVVPGAPYSIKLEALKAAYDELLLENDVEFKLLTNAIGVKHENGEVSHVMCSSKSGIYAIKCETVVDATGDADIAVWAGADYEKGDENGSMMAGTLCSLWANIDFDRVKRPDKRELDKAIQEGVFTNHDYHLPGMWRVGQSLGGGNIGHTYNVDGTDEDSMTQALVFGRKQMQEFKNYYQNYLKNGFENIELAATGSYLGIRETRRVMGDYVMNLDDFINRATFDDEIGRYSYPVDIHASNSTKESFDKFDKEHRNFRYKKGESYGIPYRALCPVKLKNVLVAGRCMSCDRYMQSSIRVMPGCFITGQAAGMAAAMAVENDNNIRNISIADLQKNLKEFGAFLPNS